jgi:hypothetical protein
MVGYVSNVAVKPIVLYFSGRQPIIIIMIKRLDYSFSSSSSSINLISS